MRQPSGSTKRLAALSALALALVACPSHGGREPGSGPGGKPVAGGSVTVAYPYEPSTLNPFVPGGDSPATRDLVRPLLPALYRLGPRGSRVPWLLASDPAARDIGGTPWGVRLHLRADAVWSDGAPITASDLRFTWKAVTTSVGVATRDPYDRLADVVVESPHVARLVFGKPFARWRDLFSAGLGVLPAHAIHGDVSSALRRSWPVSGGPYVLKSWTKGLSMVFERNPHAWGARPLLDKITIDFVPDPVTALQLYGRGAVDVIGPYAAVDLARRAKAARDGTVVSTDRGATWVGLFLNTAASALSDARVRQAIARSLDRASITEALVGVSGAALEAPGGALPTRTSPVFERYAFAPSRASSLLSAAGWRTVKGARARRRKGAELSITVASVNNDELIQRVARTLNGDAYEVGVDLNLVGVDAPDLWGSWLESSRYQAAILVERDPPGGDVRGRYSLAGPHDLARLNDPRLRSQVNAADATLNDAAPAVTAPLARAAALVPVIPLFTLDVLIAGRQGINGINASASADGFLWDCDTWWVAH